MLQDAGQGTLTYATGAPSPLSRRTWKVLMWVGVVHFVAFATLFAFSIRGVLSLLEFLRGQPFDWYVSGVVIHQLAAPALMFVNLLAVAGYAAGMHGRSPRPWFLIYVPTQLGLMLLIYAIAVALVAGSPHQVAPNSSIGTSSWTLLFLPVAFAILGLPLVLLLVPRIRRGCFAG